LIVEDSGIGIPKKIQGKIFERFEQVNKSLTRNYEGSESACRYQKVS